MALGANSAVSFGANARQVAHAVRQMPGRVVSCSRLYRTPAWPPGAGPDFANAVAAVYTNWSPLAVLERLHSLEDRHGRVRRQRWGPRVLDLDLLAAGQSIAPDIETLHRWRALPADRQAEETPDTFVLPHPRLDDRAFVLIPLMDVAPEWRHPVTGRTVRAMADALSAEKRREIRAIGPVDGVVNRKRGA